MTILKKLWNSWLRANYFLFSRLPVFFVLLVGMYWTVKLFMSMEEDTTVITNIAFGVAATLAALSFSCARAISNTDDTADRFAFAGERLLHGALILIVASLIKYTYLSIEGTGTIDPSTIYFQLMKVSFGTLVGVLFLWALTTVHGGILILNKLLWERHGRYPDWDNFC